jgi:hypothetical protein
MKKQVEGIVWIISPRLGKAQLESLEKEVDLNLRKVSIGFGLKRELTKV